MPTAFDPTAWVHHSPSPALALDAQGCVTAANDAIARCLACEPRQLIATELAGWAVDPAALRDFLRAGRGSSCEFRLRAGDGNELHLDL